MSISRGMGLFLLSSIIILVGCSSEPESETTGESAYQIITIEQNQLQPFVTFEEDSIAQPQDIIATVLSEYWGCDELARAALIANSLTHTDAMANINYSQGVFIAMRKDRITLLNSDGSYKHISATEGFGVDQQLDIPFLIQGLKQLKKFNAQ